MRTRHILFRWTVAVVLTGCGGANVPPFDPMVVHVDFGDVSDGIVLQRDIRLAHTGSSRVRLLGVSSSCSCITAITPELPLSLKPGEDVRMAIRFDTRGRHGPQERRLRIFHDQGEPILVVATGMVKVPFGPLRDAVVWANATVGEPITGSVELALYEDPAEWQVTSVTDDFGGTFEWRVADRKEAGRLVRTISLTRAPLLASARLEGRIHFQTDHPRRAYFDIDSLLLVRGHIESVPSRMGFGVADVGARRTARVLIRDEGGHPVRVDSLAWLDRDGRLTSIATPFSARTLDGKESGWIEIAAESGKPIAVERVLSARSADREVRVPVSIRIR